MQPPITISRLTGEILCWILLDLLNEEDNEHQTGTTSTFALGLIGPSIHTPKYLNYASLILSLLKTTSSNHS